MFSLNTLHKYIQSSKCICMYIYICMYIHPCTYIFTYSFYPSLAYTSIRINMQSWRNKIAKTCSISKYTPCQCLQQCANLRVFCHDCSFLRSIYVYIMREKTGMPVYIYIYMHLQICDYIESGFIHQFIYLLVRRLQRWCNQTSTIMWTKGGPFIDRTHKSSKYLRHWCLRMRVTCTGWEPIFDSQMCSCCWGRCLSTLT